MELRFKDKGLVEIDDARIIWPNFTGAPTKYNPNGGKYEFNIIIPTEELMQDLLNDGWRVKITPPQDDFDEPLRTLNIKIGLNGYRPPAIWVVDGINRVKITPETIHTLEGVEIEHVDLDISPYHSNGYQTAYLQSMVVHKRPNRFESMFADMEYPEE